MRIWLSFLIAGILLALAFARDLQYEKLYPDDLRNRVVGARLIADGKSPYFYKWKPADGLRYYDPSNFNTNIISNTTASPFLHSLVMPFSNLSQRTISFMWLLGQYVILIGMGLVAYRYAQGWGRHACLLLTGVFPFTDGWIRHVLTGQFYLLIPFLLFITYILLAGRQKNWRLLIAALCAVMVVLIRPFAALSFIPFLFVLPVTKKFIVYCVAISAAYLLFVVASPHQVQVYKDYNQFIKYAVNEHQEKPLPTRAIIIPNPGIGQLEGFNIDSIRLYKAKNPVRSFSENGNFFVLYRKVVGRQVPEQLLLAGSMLCTLLIVLLFYFGTAKSGRLLEQCVLVGFVIYLVLEMFLPMHRHQYNTVQFLFPLLLTAMYIQRITTPARILIAVGLLLNTLKWQVIPMKNTAGELLMLAGLLLATVSWKALSRSHDNPAQY